MKCNNIKCNKEHDGSYGSGKFCSRGCANSRIVSEEVKSKIRKSCKQYAATIIPWNKGKTKRKFCIVCNKEYFKQSKYHKCDDCKRKVIHFKENVLDILQIAGTTVRKILKRADRKCSICGWNEASCDIHHIIPKKDNGVNDNSNLIIICPNCHRTIHTNPNWKSKEELFKLSIKNTFPDWKDYYIMQRSKVLKYLI